MHPGTFGRRQKAVLCIQAHSDAGKRQCCASRHSQALAIGIVVHPGTARRWQGSVHPGTVRRWQGSVHPGTVRGSRQRRRQPLQAQEHLKGHSEEQGEGGPRKVGSLNTGELNDDRRPLRQEGARDGRGTLGRSLYREALQGSRRTCL